MRSRIPMFLAASLLLLAACDSSRPFVPSEDDPQFLIGSSPLQPLLQAPLQVDLWWWTDAKTSDVRYAVTIEVHARGDLFRSPVDPNMRFVATADIRTASGQTVVRAGPKKVAVSSVDPLASDEDGYALVVIAVPLTDREAQALGAALAQGTVDMEVSAGLVTTEKDGSDDVLDSVGGLFLADPRPSPLPIPDEFFN